ncbi:MAG: hypothetical protein ACTHU0_00160 [Kofleriaceae bacterium]
MKSEHEGSAGWRAGIEAALRKVRYRMSVLPDLQSPGYRIALDEVIVCLKAMLERGTETSCAQVVDAPALTWSPGLWGFLATPDHQYYIPQTPDGQYVAWYMPRGLPTKHDVILGEGLSEEDVKRVCAEHAATTTTTPS